MYDELAELFEEENFRNGASREKSMLDSLNQYIAKMMKDKNQNNYQKSRPG